MLLEVCEYFVLMYVLWLVVNIGYSFLPGFECGGKGYIDILQVCCCHLMMYVVLPIYFGVCHNWNSENMYAVIWLLFILMVRGCSCYFMMKVLFGCWSLYINLSWMCIIRVTIIIIIILIISFVHGNLLSTFPFIFVWSGNQRIVYWFFD